MGDSKFDDGLVVNSKIKIETTIKALDINLIRLHEILNGSTARLGNFATITRFKKSFTSAYLKPVCGSDSFSGYPSLF